MHATSFSYRRRLEAVITNKSFWSEVNFTMQDLNSISVILKYPWLEHIYKMPWNTVSVGRSLLLEQSCSVLRVFCTFLWHHTENTERLPDDISLAADFWKMSLCRAFWKCSVFFPISRPCSFFLLSVLGNSQCNVHWDLLLSEPLLMSLLICFDLI